jgi:hydroxymethylbilane synthase
MLVSHAATCLEDLPEGAIVGTSSLRRAAQILTLRSDLQIKDIRGNVDTRLRKLDDPAQGYDAILLAQAGLDRLGISSGRT